MEEHEPMKSTGAGGMIFRYAQEEETIGWMLKNEEHLGRKQYSKRASSSRQLMKDDELISTEGKTS